MKRIIAIAVVAALLFYAVGFLGSLSSGVIADPVPLPEFTSQSPQAWLQSEPLSVQDLRGQVLLLDVWTFDCWNCYRSFPWLNQLAHQYESKGLRVIGIHSPEFDHEKDPDRVLQKAREFKLDHPILIDNDFRYWRALNNHFWPTFYLVDKQGNLRARFIGETHAGDSNAQQIEAMIQKLLAE